MDEQKKGQTGGQKTLLLWIALSGIVLIALIFTIVRLCAKIPYTANNLMDLSALLLLLPLILLGIILIIISVLLTEKIKNANCEMNQFLNAADRKVESFAPFMDNILNGLAEPFLRGQSCVAGVKKVFDGFFKKE